MPAMSIVKSHQPVTMELAPSAAATASIPGRNSACVASKEFDGCSGDLISLNKLNGCVDLANRMAGDREDGGSATEKAIIKSRLKIPFWVADDQVLGFLPF